MATPRLRSHMAINARIYTLQSKKVGLRNAAPRLPKTTNSSVARMKWPLIHRSMILKLCRDYPRISISKRLIPSEAWIRSVIEWKEQDNNSLRRSLPLIEVCLLSFRLRLARLHHPLVTSLNQVNSRLLLVNKMAPKSPIKKETTSRNLLRATCRTTTPR